MVVFVNGYFFLAVSLCVVNANGSEIKGAFILLAKGHLLKKSLVKETNASNAVHCIQQCLDECLHCVSVNYGKGSKARGRCQLNERTASGSNMANLVADENFDYFEQDTETESTCNVPSEKGSLDSGKCDAPQPLGMESGKIQDSAITASSYYSVGLGPHTARLRKEIGNCAWAPTAADRDGCWLQVDLGVTTTVTAIATQGRCDRDYWVTTYMISYSNDNQNWSFYDESGIKKIFNGNTDRNTVVTNSFDPHIRARYMRVLPQTWQNSYPDLRIEYYGCP